VRRSFMTDMLVLASDYRILGVPGTTSYQAQLSQTSAGCTARDR
jgi:hypothetical protein